MPKLRNCTIKFHTNGDDKDDDTHLTITVRDGNQVVAARIDNDFGHWDDHSDQGPFGLMVKNQSEKAALQVGSVTIRVDPNGNDTWKFNFYLDLVFDDGSRLSGGSDGLKLTQDRQEAQFGLEGILHPA
jgi:hypothetical protein